MFEIPCIVKTLGFWIIESDLFKNLLCVCGGEIILKGMSFTVCVCVCSKQGQFVFYSVYVCVCSKQGQFRHFFLKL